MMSEHFYSKPSSPNQFQGWAYAPDPPSSNRKLPTTRPSITHHISNLGPYLKQGASKSFTTNAMSDAKADASLVAIPSFDILTPQDPKPSKIKAMKPKSTQPSTKELGIMIPYETFSIANVNCTAGKSYWFEKAIKLDMYDEENKFEIFDYDVDNIEFDLSGNGDKIVKIILNANVERLKDLAENQILVNVRYAHKYKTDLEMALRKIDVHKIE